MTALLELSGVTKQYGSLRAVDDVTLSVEQGARHALIGPNGAGKSTLFSLLAGTTASSHGAIRLAGEDITRRSDSWRARHGVAKTFQHSSLFLSLSVADNVALAAQRLGGYGLSLFTSAAKCPGVTAEVERCLAQVGLGGRAVGEQPAQVQHADAVGEAEHDVQVVLDEQDRDLAWEGLHQLGEAAALGGGHAGGRLVEQQQRRAGRQGHRHLELTALAVAELADAGRGAPVETDLGQAALDLGGDAGAPGCRGEQAQPVAAEPLRGQGDVVGDRQRQEQRGVLERLGQPGT